MTLERLRLGAVVAGLALGAATAPHAQPPAPDLVLVNGHVLTVNAAFATAEAVAIRGGRITAVGHDGQHPSDGGAAAPASSICAAARSIPGLMDNHLHGAGGGPGVDLSRARSLADVRPRSRHAWRRRRSRAT